MAGCPEALGGDSAKCTAAPGGESAGVSYNTPVGRALCKATPAMPCAKPHRLCLHGTYIQTEEAVGLEKRVKGCRGPDAGPYGLIEGEVTRNIQTLAAQRVGTSVEVRYSCRVWLLGIFWTCLV